MFGIGTGEIILILVIAVLIVGPERMVVFARQAGRLLAQFRQQSDSMTKEFREALALEELEKEFGSAKAALEETAGELSLSEKRTPSTMPSTVTSTGTTSAPATASVGSRPGSVTAVATAAVASELFLDRETDGPGPVSPTPYWLTHGVTPQDVEDDGEPIVLYLGEMVGKDEDAEPTRIHGPRLVEEAEAVTEDPDNVPTTEGLGS